MALYIVSDLLPGSVRHYQGACLPSSEWSKQSSSRSIQMVLQNNRKMFILTDGNKHEMCPRLSHVLGWAHVRDFEVRYTDARSRGARRPVRCPKDRAQIHDFKDASSSH